jgi:hypothetical protein
LPSKSFLCSSSHNNEGNKIKIGLPLFKKYNINTPDNLKILKELEEIIDEIRTTAQEN